MQVTERQYKDVTPDAKTVSSRIVQAVPAHAMKENGGT